MRTIDAPVGPGVSLYDLSPRVQAVLALVNLLEFMAMVDMIVANAAGEEEQLARLYEGWGERMISIRDWAAHQCQEIGIFGEAFDTDKPMEASDGDPPSNEA